MIIHIEICDVCGRRVLGGIPVTGFYTEGSKLTWDVGACCDGTPFAVKDTKEQQRTLLARVVALVDSELQLAGGSV